jgi:predicted RNase H-like HicB family nuclease
LLLAFGTVMGASVSGYAIVVERADDGGYGAWSPELPGCVVLGDTPDETVAEMREAIQAHIELLRERGEPVPAPTAVQVDLVRAI